MDPQRSAGTDAFSGDVLLVRLNAGPELSRTQPVIEAFRESHPGARIVALATPQTETLPYLRSDPYIDELLLFPPESADSAHKSPAALRRFMAGRRFAASIVCWGAVPEFDYRRHLLSVLLCPRPRFLMDPAGTLIPAGSARGRAVLVDAAQSLMRDRLSSAAARLARGSRRPAVSVPWPEIKRILWIRLDQIGDVAMSLPALHALKAHRPDAEIDVLVLPESAGLFERVAEVDRVWPVAINKETPDFLRDLAARNYDLAIDSRGADGARRWARLSGARLRLGYDRGPYEAASRPNQSRLMNCLVPGPAEAKHAADNNLALLAAVGIPAAREPFRFDIPAASRAYVRDTLCGLGLREPYAAIHARPGHPSKEWRPERFAAVADHLANAHGLSVLFTGAAADSPWNRRVMESANAKDRMVDSAGRFGLFDLPALFADARILVSVDTGPMHIAALAGTPIVSLFLPWFAAGHTPVGQEDGVVLPKPGTYTLDGVTVEDVVAAIDRKLGSRNQV